MTEVERRAAVESMLRTRAVESPPSPEGRRTVWHRGARGAELVSEVDAEGRVLRQEFTLFEARLIWERAGGFHAVALRQEGASPDVPGQPKADDAAPLLDQVAFALRPYSGEDRIIGHLRERATLAVAGRAQVRDVEEGPRGAAERPAPAPRRLGSMLAIALGLALVITALVALLAQ